MGSVSRRNLGTEVDDELLVCARLSDFLRVLDLLVLAAIEEEETWRAASVEELGNLLGALVLSHQVLGDE